METNRFDRIARALATSPSRRGLARLLAAGVLAAVGWDEAAGRRGKGKSKKSKRKRCKPTCGDCQICQRGRCQAKADGTPCAGGQVCDGGACREPRCGTGGPCRVFMTNSGHAGTALGGLAGADAICQQTAQTAGLAGTFKAWLSAGNSSPTNRFTNRAAAGPYQLVPNAGDGGNPPPTVAADFADLIDCAGGDCLQNAINRTEDGTPQGGQPSVWTGTLPNGTTAADTCAGWTGAGTNGLLGVGTKKDAAWTNSLVFGCSSPNSLYCFQQA